MPDHRAGAVLHSTPQAVGPLMPYRRHVVAAPAGAVLADGVDAGVQNAAEAKEELKMKRLLTLAGVIVASAIIFVVLSVQPSFAHETDHHRVTADILEEIRELRDDVEEILEEIDGGGGGAGGGGGSDGGGGGANGSYGALSVDLLDDCEGIASGISWNYDSRQSAKSAAVSECVSAGGNRSECTRYTGEFGSAFSNGTQHRCIAMVAYGSVISGTGRCGFDTGWGASETAARNVALGKCRSYSPCRVQVSKCTAPR